MADLDDGESVEMKGSGAKPYILKNVGGVYSCTCPAWRNQSIAIESRTCKHLRKLRGDAAEVDRVGQELPARSKAPGEDPAGRVGPPILLAERWDNVTDLAGWWMSEKLDGVRAYWDGKSLISRLGNPFHAPDWFLAELPETPLDGELWIGRKAFQRTVGIVRRQDRTALWKEVSYVAFDAPGHAGPFEDRLATIKAHVVRNVPPHLRAHEHVKCEGIGHLRDELARVEAQGGEGLMLRQPGSAYEVGRSLTLLKVKSFLDGEARVLDHQSGAGRHKGRLGALLVELPDGTRFSVGTGFSDAEREAPPPIGAIIAFRYQELSDGGVPRFPSYSGQRDDVPWPQPSSPSKVRPADEAGVTELDATRIPPPLSATGKLRRFECVEGNTQKFWEVSRNGMEVTVRYGRLGTAGQEKTKSFRSQEEARRHESGLIEEKAGKGYREAAPE